MSRVIVQVNLLSGRYYAHPWGEAQHAMAGPEWPPSPWRLLRGLAAAWFDARPHPVSEVERDDLLQALGTASPPALWLPPVSFVEIPYYQPILTSTPQDRVLHFDHFAVLSEGNEGACFCFDFDVVLSARQQSILAQLLARMTYLGRAESRARLSLVDTPSVGFRSACRSLYEWREQSAIRPPRASTHELEDHRARLTGRAADGSIATGHQHAFWLPKPDRRTGCLRSFTVWLPDGADGIDQHELDALLGVQHILCNDDYPILVVSERVAEMSPEPMPSRRWQAATPFLAPLNSRRGRRELTPPSSFREWPRKSRGPAPS